MFEMAAVQILFQKNRVKFHVQQSLSPHMDKQLPHNACAVTIQIQWRAWLLRQENRRRRHLHAMCEDAKYFVESTVEEDEEDERDSLTYTEGESTFLKIDLFFKTAADLTTEKEQTNRLEMIDEYENDFVKECEETLRSGKTLIRSLPTVTKRREYICRGTLLEQENIDRELIERKGKLNRLLAQQQSILQPNEHRNPPAAALEEDESYLRFRIRSQEAAEQKLIDIDWQQHTLELLQIAINAVPFPEVAARGGVEDEQRQEMSSIQSSIHLSTLGMLWKCSDPDLLSLAIENEEIKLRNIILKSQSIDISEIYELHHRRLLQCSLWKLELVFEGKACEVVGLEDETWRRLVSSFCLQLSRMNENYEIVKHNNLSSLRHDILILAIWDLVSKLSSSEASSRFTIENEQSASWSDATRLIRCSAIYAGLIPTAPGTRKPSILPPLREDLTLVRINSKQKDSHKKLKSASGGGISAVRNSHEFADLQ